MDLHRDHYHFFPGTITISTWTEEPDFRIIERAGPTLHSGYAASSREMRCDTIILYETMVLSTPDWMKRIGSDGVP